MFDINTKNNTLYNIDHTLTLPSYINLTHTSNKLGFTSTGISKYAGKLQLSFLNNSNSISIGVGTGQIYLR